MAVKLTQKSVAVKGSEDRSAHIGFYLIDKGLLELERAAGMSRSLVESLSRAINRFPLFCYLGAITLVTAFITAAVMGQAYELGSSVWILLSACVLLVIRMSSPAVDLVNWLAILLVRPHALPRIDFSSGIPEELRTQVVVPSVLTSPENVMDLLKGLEVRYLANRDINIHFGLLTDLGDAEQEGVPKDKHLLLMASQRVATLNEMCHDGIFFPRRGSLDPMAEIWRGL